MNVKREVHPSRRYVRQVTSVVSGAPMVLLCMEAVESIKDLI